MADASYPDDLKYHAEHDWARIDGDTATLGITWYAQDQLGEVVFFDPPQVGATAHQGPAVRRDRVREGRLRRHRAAVGRDRRGQRGRSSDSPENVNEDPYGDGWLVKIRLSDVSEVDDLMDASTYEGSPVLSRYTSATDADRAAMLERIGVESIDELFADDPGGRAARPRARPAAAGARSRRCTRTCASSPRATSPPTTSCRSSGAGMYDHYVPALVDSIIVALGVPDAVHAVPARGLPGHAAGDVRVPDRDQRADRPARLQRDALRGAERARRRRLPRATSTTSARAS